MITHLEWLNKDLWRFIKIYKYWIKNSQRVKKNSNLFICLLLLLIIKGTQETQENRIKHRECLKRHNYKNEECRKKKKITKLQKNKYHTDPFFRTKKKIIWLTSIGLSLNSEKNHLQGVKHGVMQEVKVFLLLKVIFFWDIKSLEDDCFLGYQRATRPYFDFDLLHH